MASIKQIEYLMLQHYEDLYALLDTENAYKLAKTIYSCTGDQSISKICLEITNSLEGQILTIGCGTILKLLTYFGGLLNTDNPRQKEKMVC